MRVISLFAFILVSTTLLSESYHHARAIGIDSASHGLLYGGRVVRRYGALYKGLQERAEDPKGQEAAKGDAKGQDGVKLPTKVPPKAPDNNNNKTPDNNKPDNNNKNKPDNKPPAPIPDNPAPPVSKNPAPPAPVPDNPTPPVSKNPAPPAPKTPAPALPANKTPTPQPAKNITPKKVENSKADDGNDPADLNSQEADNTTQGGTPVVATGSLSSSAIAGLASVGGVFVLVGGLFAFSQRKKNKEMTKSIVSNSAKAWEQQQNSTYEIMEEETKPIGSFMVTATYTPTLSDELEIQPGDRVTILVEYDDGWVQGINETRGGIKGVFPRHCVDMSQPSNKTNKNNKRSSSMGGGYTEVDLS